MTSRDLLLLDAQLADDPIIRAGVSASQRTDHVFIASRGSDREEGWTPFDGGVRNDIEPLLRETLLVRPGMNRLVVCCRTPVDALLAIFDAISAVSDDFDVGTLVVLAGPIDSEEAKSGLRMLAERQSHRGAVVMLLGNEDVGGGTIDDARRVDVVCFFVVAILRAGFDWMAAAPLFFFGEGGERRVAEERQGVGEYAGFVVPGVAAFFPGPREHVAACRAAVNGLLSDAIRQQLQPESRPGELIDDLKNRPNALVSQFRKLALAGTGESPDEPWPNPFPNPFGGPHFLPLTSAAEGRCHALIENAVTQIKEDWRAWTRELDVWGRATRIQAWEVWKDLSDKEYSWMKEYSGLGRIAILLLHYFPGYPSVRPSANDTPEPCQPARTPGLAEIENDFRVMPQSRSRELCRRLPTAQWLVVNLIGWPLGGVALAGLLSWRLGPSPWWLLAPVVGGCWALWYWLRTRSRSRAIQRELSAIFETGANDWSRAYRKKLLWLREKGTLRVVNHFVADSRRVGTRLEALFRQVFGPGQLMVAADGPSRGYSRREEEVRERMRSHLRDLAALLLEKAAGKDGIEGGNPSLEQFMTEVVEESYRAALAQVEQSPLAGEVREEFLAATASREQPTLLGCFGAEELDPRVWVRILAPMHDFTSGEIPAYRTGHAGDVFVNVVAPIPGPTLLAFRKGLNLEQAVAALGMRRRG